MTKFLIMLLNVSMPVVSVGIYYTDQFISKDLNNNAEEVMAEDDSILQYQKEEKFQEHLKTHQSEHKKTNDLATQITAITFAEIKIEKISDKETSKHTTISTTPTAGTVVKSIDEVKKSLVTTKDEKIKIDEQKKQTADLKQLLTETSQIITDSQKYKNYLSDEKLITTFSNTFQELKTKIETYKKSIQKQIRESAIPTDRFSMCQKTELNVQYSYVEMLSENLDNVLKIANTEENTISNNNYQKLLADLEKRRCKNWKKFKRN